MTNRGAPASRRRDGPGLRPGPLPLNGPAGCRRSQGRPAIVSLPVTLLLAFLLTLLTLVPALLRPSALGQSPAIPDPAKAGQELAERLRQAGPSKSAEFTGRMIIVRPNLTNTLPIASRITVGATNWQVRYTAGEPVPTDTLVIDHRKKGIVYHTSDPQEVTHASPPALGSNDLFRPFAGSDFWRVDLGLDFLWWPGQRQIANQMRRGRACRVLESRRPVAAPGTYQRVISWVDVETDGILKAEAYDSAGQQLKEFLVGRFRKVDGQYQLEEMTIRVPQTDDETTIRFDLDR